MNEELNGIIKSMQEENNSLVNKGLEPRYNDLDFENVVKTHKAQTIEKEEPVGKKNGSTVSVAGVEPTSTAIDSVYKHKDGSLELPSFHDDDSTVVGPPIIPKEDDVEFNVEKEIKDEVEVKKTQTIEDTETVNPIKADEDKENKGDNAVEVDLTEKDKDDNAVELVEVNTSTDEDFWVNKITGLNEDFELDEVVISEDDKDTPGFPIFNWFKKEAKEVVEVVSDIASNYAPEVESMGIDLVTWWNEILEATHKGVYQSDFIPGEWDFLSNTSIENTYDGVYTDAAMDKQGGKHFWIDWDPEEENNPANIDNYWNIDNYVVAHPGSEVLFDEDGDLLGIADRKAITLEEIRRQDLERAKYILGPEQNYGYTERLGSYDTALKRELVKIANQRKAQGWVVLYRHNRMPVGYYHTKWKIDQYNKTLAKKDEMIDVSDRASYVQGFKEGDPSKIIGATARLFSSLTQTMIPAYLTGGVSMFPQITAPMVVSYNIEKARSLYPWLPAEQAVAMLIAQGQDEVLTPTVIGTIASCFELIGFKGITSAIQMAKMSGIKKIVSQALYAGGKEGATEWAQLGAEYYNRSMAKTTHIEDINERHRIAAETAVNAMFSEEGLEMIIMGAFGGSFMAGSGGVIQRYLLRDKASFTFITDRLSKIAHNKELLLKSNTLRPGKSDAFLQKEIDDLTKEIQDHIEQVGRKASLLTNEEIENIAGNLEAINAKYREQQELEYEYFRNLEVDGKSIVWHAANLKISLEEALKLKAPSYYDDYIITKKGLGKEYTELINAVEDAKSKANKRLIDKGITFAIGKVGEKNVVKFETKAELTTWFNQNKDKNNLVGGKTLKQYLRADGAVVKQKDGNKVIIINYEQAVKLNAISVAQHEVFHYVFGRLLRDSDGKMTAEGVQLVKDFLDKLSPRARVLIQNRVARNYNTTTDSNGDLMDLNIYEEYLAAYVDARVKNEISREESIIALNFIKKRSINALKGVGYDNAKFKTADDVQNWLESYIDDYNSSDSNVKRIKAESKGTSSTMMSNTDLEPVFDAIAKDQTAETWNETGSQKAINWMFGKFDNLIGATITQQMREGENWTSDEDYIMDVYVKLIPHVRGFNFKRDKKGNIIEVLWGTDLENTSLWGWVVPYIRRKGWDVLKEKKVKPKTKETPISLDDDATFANDIEGSEYVDINAAIEDNVTFTKLRKLFGIKRDGPIHLKLKEWIGKKIGIVELSELDTAEFKKQLKTYFKAILFDDIKKIIGTPGSTKYKNWIRNNGERLYNLLPQEVMNNQYSDFIIKGKENISPTEVDKAIKDGILPKGTPRTSGPTLYTKKPYAEIEQEWINHFLNPTKGRPASKQNSLLDLVSWFLGFDATMEVINSKEFKAENDVAMITIATIGMKIDRGADVMFSNSDGEIVLLNAASMSNSDNFIQEAGDIARWVSINVGFDEIAPSELKPLLNIEFPDTDSRIIDLIVSLADTDAIKNSDSEQFKAQVFTTLKELGFDETINDIKKDGTVKYSDAAQERIYNTAVILAHKFGPRIMKVLGWEILGFKNGVLDPAKTKKDANGNVIPGAQGKYYEKLQELKLAVENQSKDQIEERVVIPDDLNLTDARKMNKAFALFKKIERILFDGTSTGEFETNLEWKKNEIGKMAKEIKAAGKANIELAKLTAKTIIESGLDHASVIHLLQIQTSITSGFRAWTTLDLITILEGSQKPDRNHPYFAQELEKAKVEVYGPKHKKAGQLKYDTPKKQFDAAIEALKTKGEHVRANANTMAEIAELDAKYRKNPNIDLDAELDKIFSKHSQLHTTKGVTGEIDDAGGLTNTSDEKRVMLTDRRDDMFTPEGVTAEESVAIKGAESLFSKSEMIENIKLKNINQIPIQGATVMDFDDTVATSKSLIRYTKPDGTKGTLNAEQYAKTYQELTDLGYEWDFSEFNEVVEGKRGPLFEKLKNQIAKYGADNVYILTARPMDAAVAIQAWLASEGINLPIENITGLGNSTGEAKADWIENNLILNGFNDIYFVDDAHLNVEAVDKMFKTYPEGLLVDGGKSVLVESNLSISDEFNQMIEENEGIKKESVYSKAKANILGSKVVKFWDFIYPPSAYDLELFLYRILGKGEKGEKDMLFFKENLLDPYNQAYANIQEASQKALKQYRALVKKLPKVRKKLSKKVPGSKFTYDQAIRVSIWVDMDIDMQEMGLSKADQKILIDAVKGDIELSAFKDALKNIPGKDGYVKPSINWTVETIAYDLNMAINSVSRAKFLAKWKENVEQIFSEENKRKLEVLYSKEYVEALEDMLYRMEYGRGKNIAGRIERNWNNWVNNSVGAIMFFNFRSASLQTISFLNYFDWKNNSPLKIAKVLANPKQFISDVVYIFNSDYLLERRSGNKRTINEAELSAWLKGKENKAKAFLAFLLEKGFTPTQIADSFAIALGGSFFYRNQVDFYVEQGMPLKEAEKAAWKDFIDKTEKGQQSSRPDLISQQQAGGLGRLILAFKNTPMQYNRLMIKAVLDLKNGRGKTKEHLSKIAYYGMIQNVIFSSLQTAIFAALGDEDEWDSKKERVANGMIDSILNGMGLTGAVAATIKNGYLRYRKEKKRGFNADHTRTIIEFANLSPTIGSKLRKLYGAIRTEQLNKEAIEGMGFTIENPAFNSIANLISATTNVPLDRAVTIAQNLILASKDETEFWESTMLILGWNPWDIGVDQTSRKVQSELKEKKKELKKKLKKLEDQQKKEEALKKKQEEQKKKGEPLTCSKCNRKALPGKTVCTVHEVKEQRKDGVKKRCIAKKTDGTQCKEMTANKSGECYYHD